MKNFAHKLMKILPGMGNSLGIQTAANGAGSQYGSSNDLIHTFMLDVAEPFDAHGIWHSTYSLSDNLLKNLLDAHPYSTVPGQYWIHACVVIELPSQAIQTDLTRANGALSQNLLNLLQTLHLEAFGKRTDPSLRPRYVVRKNGALQKGQIRVCFGQGVYVPEEGEACMWRVEQSSNVVDWELATEIHEKQRLAVLGSETTRTSRHTWPFGPDFSITVINAPDASATPHLTFYAEPADSLRVEFDSALDCHKVSVNPAYGFPSMGRLDGAVADERFFCIRTVRLQADLPGTAAIPPAKPQLTAGQVVKPAPVKLAAVKPAPIEATINLADVNPACQGTQVAKAMPDEDAPPPRVWRHHAIVPDQTIGSVPETEPATYLPSRAKPLAEAPNIDATFIATAARVQRHTVSLIGIALQRVSLYRDLDILGLQFAVDSRGMVLAPNSPQAKLTFAVDAKDGLSVEIGTARRSIGLGQAMPVSNVQNVQIEALPACANYIGWYRLPTPISEPVWQVSRFAFGRTHKALQKLRLLSGSGFLHAVQDKDGDRMGLSREHFLMEITEPGLAITSCVKQGRMLHLDENLGFVEDMDADCKSDWLLPQGHHLVVGHYLLRYEL